MKTAREMIDDATNFGGKALTRDSLVELMQIYAEIIAQQALKDAAETKQIDGVTPYFSPSEQLEITNTPILTP